EISQAIVAALKLKLLPGERKAIETRGTENAEAYNLYLMARQYYLTGNFGDKRREEAIIRFCQRAAALDPKYAQAWTLQALAENRQRYYYGVANDGGMASAERALSIDSNLGAAHGVKAGIFFEDGKMAEAEIELAEALRLDPESFDVNRTAALINLRHRRYEEAIRYFEKAAALVEADFSSPGMLVTCYTAIGDLAACRRAAQISLTRAEKALAQDQNNGAAMGFGVCALAALGEAERAKEWIDRALLIDPDNLTMRYNFACAAAIDLKEPDMAIELLAPFFERTPLEFLIHVKNDPDLDSLRDDPRFQAMVAGADARLGVAS
ncbi:MAG TPA: hypothetical protein PLS69_15550, partial [Terricaulis sp.]|nr:hypothetical protein [Terricaulis sp.]